MQEFFGFYLFVERDLSNNQFMGPILAKSMVFTTGLLQKFVEQHRSLCPNGGTTATPAVPAPCVGGRPVPRLCRYDAIMSKKRTSEEEITMSSNTVGVKRASNPNRGKHDGPFACEFLGS